MGRATPPFGGSSNEMILGQEAASLIPGSRYAVHRFRDHHHACSLRVGEKVRRESHGDHMGTLSFSMVQSMHHSDGVGEVGGKIVFR